MEKERQDLPPVMMTLIWPALIALVIFTIRWILWNYLR